MHIEEEKRLSVLVSDIPAGGVFKPLSGEVYMKILPKTENENKGVCLTNGTICTFSETSKAIYFENASVKLKL